MGASRFRRSPGVGPALGRSRKEVSEREPPPALSPGSQRQDCACRGAEQGSSQKAGREYEC